jgi:hypothetical protein
MRCCCSWGMRGGRWIATVCQAVGELLVHGGCLEGALYEDDSDVLGV